MIELQIREAIANVAKKQKQTIVEEIERDSVLLNIGLDSLSYAILVVELEELLGIDPFQIEDKVIYPRTFGEFVDLYIKHCG